MYFPVMAKYAVQGLQTQVPSLSLTFNLIQKLNALHIVEEVSDTVVMA